MKKKYIIRWDAGYGSDDYDIIEAESPEAANNEAYQAWLDAIDHDYDAEEYTPERFDELDLGSFYGIEKPEPPEVK